ncbi:hypothetical protein [uncultured Sphingomonas sp.]|uniref:hypothetical protein n=1 Tax=uncultured Sphingomonas sp. TaxID=158754 RepID=UPI0035CA1C0C
MDATSRRQHLILPVAPSIAAGAGMLIAMFLIALPAAVLEWLVVDSGIAALVTAAEPPLGLTARLAIAGVAGGVTTAMLWLGLHQLIGGRSIVLGTPVEDDGAPVLRRADAHPDAPSRRPLFAASDLGTPFLDIHAPAPTALAEAKSWPEERTLPADLDTPIAPFAAPETLPEVAEDAADVAATATARFGSHERIETFELTPMIRPPAPAADVDETSAPLPQATIHDLLTRLERGVHRRATAASGTSETSLEETLGVLRRLATRVG